VQELQDLLSRGVFAVFPENENSVVIADAGMRITRAAGNAALTGPDHLQRLFAYNHIAAHLGTSLYSNMEGDAALVKEATEAYVVSPISSLVVLETAADYERFGIKDDASSLKNASAKSQGAVPEPHEWALIILALGVLIWVKFRRHPAAIKVKS
jgi:XrtN system VIT domain protein